MSHFPSKTPDFQQPIEIDLDDIHNFGLWIRWGQNTIGFGELSVSVKDGKISMDTEGMGREWTRRALHSVIEAILAQAFDEEGRPK